MVHKQELFSANEFWRQGNKMKIHYQNVNEIVISISTCSKSQVVDDSICLELAGAKPATISECNIGVICPEWHVGVWQPVILLKQTILHR